MKKIIKILLVCLVTFGLTACSQENQDTTKTIKWNKENKLDNLISYQIESIGKPKQIIPDTINDTYTYYKPHWAADKCFFALLPQKIQYFLTDSLVDSLPCDTIK